MPNEHRGAKEIPPEVKTVNMIYVTHIPKRERKRALRDVYTIEPVALKFNHGQPVRSLLIAETIRPVSVMEVRPH